MTFAAEDGEISIIEVTNLSTGYCPEPECWKSVQAALDAIGVGHPGHFTSEYQFRRCIACGMRNVVKDECYMCGVCGADLTREWNFKDKQEDAQP